LVDFSKYQVKKSEGIKTTPEDKDQKGAHAHLEKVPKPNLKPKEPKTQNNPSIDVNIIDNKINEVVNDRLVKLGLKHELTIENMIQYFKENRKLKLYNLIRYFSDAKPNEVENMLKYLHNTGKLKKDKNGWFWLK